MKRIAIIAALLLPAAAFAQPPVEISAKDTIYIRDNQPKTFSFDQPVRELEMDSDGVAKVIPRTDKVFTFQPVRPGSVMVTALAAGDNHVIHRFNIVVEPTSHIVKVYGLHKKGREVTDFISFNCNETGCGRADPDLQKDGPSAVTFTETHPTKDGGNETVSKEYR